MSSSGLLPFPWNFCPACGQRLNEENDGEKLRPFCNTCQKFYYHNPIPVTACIVLNHNSEILLTRRAVDPAKGEWCLPGGFMELAETPEESAIRELAEETGLIAKEEDLKMLGVFSFSSKTKGGILMICYFVKKWDGILSPGSDVSEAVFFPSYKLPHLAFPSHSFLIELFLRKYK
ncbi:MAG: NUDIX domain-containing protein [Candidatus Hydrogenedentes bacterium]|nr:NUDIX domain-containing protein [Candidatus Hydrogenedentota bacterium]